MTAHAATGRESRDVGAVSHVGRWMTDPQGRVLIFHGADIDLSAFDAKKDPALMKSSGFNSVKFYVPGASIEPKPGVFDDKYLAKIKDDQQALWRHGIYSVLDIQGGANFGDMNQGYVTVPGTSEHVQDPTGVLSKGLFPVLNQGEQNFWDNRPGAGGVPVWDLFAAMAKHFAAFFRGTPGISGYSLFNEIVPGSSDNVQDKSPMGDPHFDVDVLAPFYRNAMAAMREADPTTPIHYEPNANFNLNYTPSWIPRLGDRNVVFDYHAYANAAASPFSGAPLGASRAGEAQLVADRNNAPAFAAEMFYSANLDQFDKAMQGWNYFMWEPAGTPTFNPLVHLGGCADHPTAGLDGTRGGWAGCFVRPYPRAIAGTPTGWSFDAISKTFTLTYRTRQPGGAVGTGTTEVFVPKLIYPSGFSLALNGARVADTGMDGQVLELRANRGADSVSVTVTPK